MRSSGPSRPPGSQHFVHRYAFGLGQLAHEIDQHRNGGDVLDASQGKCSSLANRPGRVAEALGDDRPGFRVVDSGERLDSRGPLDGKFTLDGAEKCRMSLAFGISQLPEGRRDRVQHGRIVGVGQIMRAGLLRFRSAFSPPTGE